jgi:hypothetical protein
MIVLEGKELLRIAMIGGCLASRYFVLLTACSSGEGETAEMTVSRPACVG